MQKVFSGQLVSHKNGRVETYNRCVNRQQNKYQKVQDVNDLLSAVMYMYISYCARVMCVY